MKKSGIKESRLRKEKEFFDKNPSNNYSIVFSEDLDLTEVTTYVNGFVVVFHIEIPENYPFKGPKVILSQDENLINLTDFNRDEDFLEQVLGESWLPIQNLKSVSEKLVSYAQQSFKLKDETLIIDIFNIRLILSVLCTVLFSLLVRVSVISCYHQGWNNPPFFGEYEKYRYWMSIAYNSDSENWYKTDDYLPMKNPPFNGFFCWILSFISLLVDSDSIEKQALKGYFSVSHKIFMRTSVILFETLFFTSSLLLFFRVYYKNLTNGVKGAACTVFLLSPCFVIISHVHFSFNIIGLGLALISFILAIQDHLSLSAIVIALAVNFKKEVFPYFLCLLVAWTVRIYSKTDSLENFSKKFIGILVSFSEFLFGFTSVIMCFALTTAFIWHPWLINGTTTEVVSSIFSPSVQEDTLPISLILIKNIFDLSHSTTFIVSCVLVTSFSLSFIIFFPIKKTFGLSLLYCLSGVNMSFYLFYYQNQTDFVLFSLLPVLLLFIIDYPELFRLFSILLMMSVYKISVAEHTRAVYFVLLLVFFFVSQSYANSINYLQNRSGFNLKYIYFCILALHAFELFYEELAISLINYFVHFSISLFLIWLLVFRYKIRDELSQKYYIEKRFRKINKIT